MLTSTIVSSATAALAADIQAGLTKPGQKELPSKYLYDTLGSKLFEVISELPEYGLTRADERLLRDHSGDIARIVTGDVVLCELGSGSGRKTRWVLEALARGRHIDYYPIEISRAALAMCERELGDLESISVVGLERHYLDGLLEVAARRRAGQRILVLFLGSTIGNFSHPADREFLREIRRILDPGDWLLVGSDLMKPIPQLLSAYDDGLGVTAAFNMNLLARINRELGANFALDQFRHTATFNPDTNSVEMHLRSLRDQTVEIPGADLTVAFQQGETIWTENSHKYSREEVVSMATSASFGCTAQWIDQEWPFAESLLMAR